MLSGKGDSMGADGFLHFDTRIDESGFSSGVRKLGNIAKGGLSILGGAVAGITAAMGAGAAASIKVGASFEAEMSKVSAISGATGNDLDALTEKAKEMGAKTKFSASESAEAMEYMAMAGWKTGDMLNGIEGIMNLAAASGQDLAATSDIVTDALTAFGMSAADSGRFADVLAAASSNANTDVSMMGETFKYVAPVAGALGYSAEDTAVAIGLMANSGIKASQAGTSLRGMLSRMIKPTDEVQGAMDKLGISMTDASGNIKPFDTLIGDLRSSFSGLSEAEKTQMASSLAGQEAMSGLLAIVNASDADFNKLKDSIYNCDGAAEKMAETMQDNLPGQLTILKSSAEGLGIEIYESIQKPLTGLAKAGIDAINSLTDAFKSNGTEGLIEAGGKIITDLLIGIADKLPGVLDTAIQVIQSIVSNLDANLPQIVSAGGKILTSLIGGIASLLPSLGKLALDLILQIADGITTNAPQMIPKGIEVLLGFISGIVDNLPKLLEAGLNMIVALAEGLINSLPVLIEQVPKLINSFFDALDSFLPKILLAGLKLIVELGKGIIQSIPTIIANAGEIVKAILNVILHLNLFNAGKGIIKGLGNGLKSVGGFIKETAKSIVDMLKHPFSSGGWGDIGKNIVQGIANGLKNGVGAIVDAAKGAAKSALNAAKSFLGIHSPSTVFRDQVGKYMAQGMGIGFEDNMPVDTMEKSINKAVGKVQNAVSSVNSEALKTSSVPAGYNPPLADDTPIVVENNNTFIVDSTPLVNKTTKAVIKKTGSQHKNRNMYMGK